MKPVLLLSSSYEPMKILCWKRAIIMWSLNKVEVIKEYDVFIRSASFSMRAPAVIKLNSHYKIYRKEVKYSRKNILARDFYTCQYCGINKGKLTVDHIIPRSRGGLSSFENCVASCLFCNIKKSNRLLSEAGMKLLSKPKTPIWTPALIYRMSLSMPTQWKDFIWMVK